jgi:Xaa-Pro dipeptidase
MEKLSRPRIAELQRRLTEQGLDAMLIIKPEHVRYISGFWGYNPRPEYAMPRRLVCTIMPAVGEPTLIVPKIEYNLARRRTWLSDIRAHVEWESSEDVRGGIALLGNVLAEKSLKGKKIGIEKNFVSVALYEILRDELDIQNLVNVSGVIEAMRMVKAPEEIEILRIGATMAVQEYYAEVEAIRPGVREYEIAMRGRDEATRQFAWHLSHANLDCPLDHPVVDGPQIVTSGPRLDMVHALASTRTIAHGDMILLDLCRMPQFQSYRMGFSRMASLRQPNTEESDMFHTVMEAYHKAVSLLRPGVLAEEPDLAAREMLDKANLGETFLHRTGRGVGLEIVELPEIGAGDKTPLRPGMVVTVEPSIYFSGFAVHVEDTFLVTEDGPEWLTQCPRELNVLAR